MLFSMRESVEEGFDSLNTELIEEIQKRKSSRTLFAMVFSGNVFPESNISYLQSFAKYI